MFYIGTDNISCCVFTLLFYRVCLVIYCPLSVLSANNMSAFMALSNPLSARYTSRFTHGIRWRKAATTYLKTAGRRYDERAVRWDALGCSPGSRLEAVTRNSFGIIAAAKATEDQRLSANSWVAFQSGTVVYPSYLGSMLKRRALRVKSALVRECMAEFLGTFVLLVSELDFFKVIIIFFKSMQVNKNILYLGNFLKVSLKLFQTDVLFWWSCTPK